MADIRTLKLNLLADTSDFHRGLMGSQKATKTFAGRVGLYTRRAAEGFALVGAAAATMALKIGVDSVKAAMEDEASQTRLQVAMRKTIGATQDQVDATEALIRKQQFLKGFSDTELRGAFQRLLASTKDVKKANDLLSLSQDVARGTGKPLEAVALAIGKALDGNLGALKRLGVPLDQNIIKTKDTTGALQALTDLYGGQASAYADTFAGKMATLRQRTDELKEGIGARLIPVLSDAVPHFQRIIGILSGEGPGADPRANMNGTIADSIHNQFYGTDAFAESMLNLKDSFGQFFSGLLGDGPDAQSTLKDLADGMNALAKAINRVGEAFKFLNDQWDKLPSGLKTVAKALGTGPLGPLLNGLVGRATGGPVSANRAYLVGERGPELFVPNANGSIMNAGKTANLGGGGGVTIVMNGIVDAESARRSIESLIQRSQRRSGPVNWAGAVS